MNIKKLLNQNFILLENSNIFFFIIILKTDYISEYMIITENRSISSMSDTYRLKSNIVFYFKKVYFGNTKRNFKFDEIVCKRETYFSKF